jgi:predicted enzyme related to lactoylglutathione lyase
MMKNNAFTWVELYVNDMNRARKFYETVLQVEMVDMVAPDGIGDFEMVSFPWIEGVPNISGALVKSPEVTPGQGGTIVYFGCEDCANEIGRVQAAGGTVCQPKFSIGDYGYCGICLDTEGNMIGFHSMQ